MATDNDVGTGLTAEQRALRGRIGAHLVHSRGRTNTGPARAAFAAKFYEGIPEDLPQAERDRRAAHAKKAHVARLAMKSAQARKRS